ncbi:MAG: ribonuclease [Bacillota bacterium]|jgi:ribonuclease Y
MVDGVFLNIFFIISMLLVGGVLGYCARFYVSSSKIALAEKEALSIVEKSRLEAERLYNEKIFTAKEKAHHLIGNAEREATLKQSELDKLSLKLSQEQSTLIKEQEDLVKQKTTVDKLEEENNKLNKELEKKTAEQTKTLEQIARFSRAQAKDYLLARTEQEMRQEVARIINNLEQEAIETGTKKAQNILALAIQRCAVDHVTDTTVAVIALPSEEMKGRIIGREGRNIRTIEALTGVDLIIDDTPEAVVLSAFDPVRREIARIALEKLIDDGRIHPASIEEMVNKAQTEVEQRIREYGEQAAFEVGVYDLNHQLTDLLGRLRFRTGYGQNVLKHSLEVAYLSGLLASELNLDIRMAKRAGLLHDIGKALDHEHEGSHVDVGVQLAKKYKESSIVINAIESHHGNVDPDNVISVLVKAADTLSAARPGARKETVEKYIKRLERLEEICNQFSGVEKSFAVQAGRECRIIVKPNEVDDSASALLARDITKKIENQLKYPGQIKVTVIRETRATEYAK